MCVCVSVCMCEVGVKIDDNTDRWSLLNTKNYFVDLPQKKRSLDCHLLQLLFLNTATAGGCRTSVFVAHLSVTKSRVFNLGPEIHFKRGGF